MYPSKRHGINKNRSAKKFRSQHGRTKQVNVKAGLARGGIRL